MEIESDEQKVEIEVSVVMPCLARAYGSLMVQLHLLGNYKEGLESRGSSILRTSRLTRHTWSALSPMTSYMSRCQITELVSGFESNGFVNSIERKQSDRVLSEVGIACGCS